MRSGDVKKVKTAKLGPMARISGEKSPQQLREFVSDCFGVSMYSKADNDNIEERLCRDKHAGSMLHFTRGELPAHEVRSGEIILQRKQNRAQAEANRRYYNANIVAHRLAIIRLTERVRNCILVHLDDSMLKSRAGALDARTVWRAVYLNDPRIFLKHERASDTELSVDLLLDGSASQLQRQESVASQAYILAESLTRCGVPVRVMSFCTVADCTVMRVYRDYGEVKNNGAVFEYAAAGFNRDGLALRAVGQLLSKSPYERRLLITLSDCSPNDVRKICDEQGRRREYQGEQGVTDSAGRGGEAPAHGRQGHVRLHRRGGRPSQRAAHLRPRARPHTPHQPVRRRRRPRDSVAHKLHVKWDAIFNNGGLL